MKRLFLIFVLVVSMCSLVYAYDEYTPTTETSCYKGVCSKVLYSGLTFYDNGSGYQKINTTIIPTSRANYIYQMQYGAFDVYFKNNSNDKDVVTFTKNGYNFSFDISTSQMKWYNSTLNAEVGMTTNMNPQDTNISIENNVATYKNAWINTTLIYEIYNEMLKETLNISQVYPKSSGVQVDYLQYVSNNYFNNSLQVCADGKCFLHPTSQKIDTNGTIEFKDVNNVTIYYLPIPIVTDSANNTGQAYYSASASNGIIIIRIRIPKIFIDNATFPIYFDPTVKLSIDSNDLLTDVYVANSVPGYNLAASSYLVTASNTGTGKDRIYLQFNVSSLPNNINIESSYLYIYYNGYACAGTKRNVSIYRVYNDVWNETNIDWNNQTCGSNFDSSTNCNLSSADNISITFSQYNEYKAFNTTQIIQAELSQVTNGTASMIVREEPEDNENCQLNFYSTRYSDTTVRPYLNITYGYLLKAYDLRANLTHVKNNTQVGFKINITNLTLIDTVLIEINGTNYTATYDTRNSSDAYYNFTINFNSTWIDDSNYSIIAWVNDSASTLYNSTEKIYIKLDTISPIINRFKIFTNFGRSFSTLFNVSMTADDVKSYSTDSVVSTKIEFTNNTLLVNFSNLTFNSRIFINDTLDNPSKIEINLSMANTTYYQNISRTNNLTIQYISFNTNISQNNNYTLLNISWSHEDPATAATLIFGGSGNITNANNSYYIYSLWSGNWFQVYNSTGTAMSIDTTKNQTTTLQYYILAGGNITINNTIPIDFYNVNISSSCLQNDTLINLTALSSVDKFGCGDANSSSNFILSTTNEVNYTSSLYYKNFTFNFTINLSGLVIHSARLDVPNTYSSTLYTMTIFNETDDISYLSLIERTSGFYDAVNVSSFAINYGEVRTFTVKITENPVSGGTTGGGGGGSSDVDVCGDGICGAIEKSVCPDDCLNVTWSFIPNSRVLQMDKGKCLYTNFIIENPNNVEALLTLSMSGSDVSKSWATIDNKTTVKLNISAGTEYLPHRKEIIVYICTPTDVEYGNYRFNLVSKFGINVAYTPIEIYLTNQPSITNVFLDAYDFTTRPLLTPTQAPWMAVLFIPGLYIFVIIPFVIIMIIWLRK